MNLPIKIHFYEITKCGYYKYGEDKAKFGNLAEITPQIHCWLKERDSIDMTCTYKTDENRPQSTYCFDTIYNNKNKDLFITTWNETPSNRGKVPSVSAKEKVGQATVYKNDIEKDSIPGYPTYFWFIAELNKLATIRIDSNYNGKYNLVNYMRGFIEKFTNNAVMQEEADDLEKILGYRKEPDAEILDLIPCFDARILRKSGELQLILDNYSKIRKIIRKSRLDLNIQQDLNFFQKMIQKLGIENFNGEQENNALRFYYEIPFTPSQLEIREIINNAKRDGLSSINDVGFQFKNDTRTYWLSNSIIKYEEKIEIEEENFEIIDLNNIMNFLYTNKHKIYEILKH